MVAFRLAHMKENISGVFPQASGFEGVFEKMAKIVTLFGQRKMLALGKLWAYDAVYIYMI